MPLLKVFPQMLLDPEQAQLHTTSSTTPLFDPLVLQPVILLTLGGNGLSSSTRLGDPHKWRQAVWLGVH